VTSVLLWTKALTGVGALIALGNQPENGNCALFVEDIRNKNKLIKPKTSSEKKLNNNKKTKAKKSPNRLDKTVTKLPFTLSKLP